MIKITKKNLTMEEAFKKFNQRNKIKNLSDATMRFYKSNYGWFKKFTDECNIEMIEEVDNDVIEKYILHLRGRLNNPISINTYLRAVRSFLYYCMDNNMLERFKIKLLKADKKPKETYSTEQLNRLLVKPEKGFKNFSELRDWTISSFLIGTGVRASTLINIKIEDIDFDNKQITLTKTKNRKGQIIPLSETLIKRLMEYLETRGVEPKEYLFPTRYNKKLNREGLSSAIVRYNRRRGVDKTSIHIYRHTFSKIFILNGGSIEELRMLLGHSSIQTTDNYVNLLVSDIQPNYESKNPLNILLGKNKKYIKLNKKKQD
jgi:integrase/recombinase XerD